MFGRIVFCRAAVSLRMKLLAFLRSKEKDPVCGMRVDPKEAKWKKAFLGRTYYFCSADCHAAFGNEPGKFVRA